VAAAIAVAALAFASLAQAAVTPVVIGGSAPEAPAVSGTKVVWADKRASGYDVFCYDALTGKTTRLVSDPNDQLQPDIDGNVVVWSDMRSGDADLWAYDLSTGTARRLTSYARMDEWSPSVSGDWVTWISRSSGGRSANIYAYNMRTGEVVYPGYGSGPVRGQPELQGNLIVWAQQEPGRTDYDIYLHDLAAASGGPIASTPAPTPHPR
jgi:TolB protein